MSEDMRDINIYSLAQCIQEMREGEQVERETARRRRERNRGGATAA